MVWFLRRCSNCHVYTLDEESCPRCGGPVRVPHPAKFSMDDRFRKYRLRMRRIARTEEPKSSQTQP